MSVIIMSLTSIINLLNSIKRSKYKLPIVLILILLWVIMGANTQNPDINAYIISYNSNIVGVDFGYSTITKLFSSLGFSYYTFRIFITFIGLFLINRTVVKLVKNKSAFYLLYIVYPFIIDVVQIRNFLVMSMLIFLVPYLLNDTKIDKTKYIIGILIASSFQLTAIFYLPLIFISKIKKNILYKTITIMIIITIIFVSLNRPLLNMLSEWIILHFGDFDDRISLYTRVQTHFGFLLLWVLQFASYALVMWATKIFKRNKRFIQTEVLNSNDRDSKNTLDFKYMEFIKWINIYAFFFFPFYVFQMTFARLLRNIIPLNIIAFLITEQSFYKTGKKDYLFRFAYLCFQMILIWVDLKLLYPNIDIYKILINNWIF